MTKSFTQNQNYFYKLGIHENADQNWPEQTNYDVILSRKTWSIAKKSKFSQFVFLKKNYSGWIESKCALPYTQKKHVLTTTQNSKTICTDPIDFQIDSFIAQFLPIFPHM